MNEGGRVVLCGQIAVYNTDLPYPPPLPEKTAQIIAERHIKRYIVYRELHRIRYLVILQTKNLLDIRVQDSGKYTADFKREQPLLFKVPHFLQVAPSVQTLTLLPNDIFGQII